MRKITALLLIVFLLLFQQGTAIVAGAEKNPEKFTAAKKTIKVQPLTAGPGPSGKWGGDLASLEVKVRPKTSKSIKIGFFEEDVGTTGPMWKSSGWTAAIISTFLLNLNLADYSFVFDIRGSGDGPSAGALMTVSVLASLLGDSIRKDATMTGTINPDGTIGPVGGVPHKIEAAAKEKKKIILIPIGQRFSMDMNTEQSVDVVDLGRKKGAKVKEVGDIYTAYKLLTGKKLPKPDVSDEQPDIPTRTFNKLKSKTNEWYSKYVQISSEYASIAPEYKTENLDGIMSVAAAYAEQSQIYTEKGLIAPSYNQAFFAVVYADIAYQTAKTIEAYLTGGIDAAKQRLEAASTSWLRSDAFLDRIKSEKPRSLSDVMTVVDAYGFFSIAIGLGQEGDFELENPAETEEDVLGNLAGATTSYALAGHVLTKANDILDVGMGMGSPKKPDKQRVQQLSKALNKAAIANLELFESQFIDQIADEEGISLDAAKELFASIDFDYAYANSSLNIIPSLKKELGPGISRDYATLGNSLLSYSLSSSLIAKYLSIQTIEDEEGNIVDVENEKAMINMLDLAEQQAAENINLAKKTKANPALPIYYFESGKVLREGNIEDKINSLSEFWNASLEARLMAMLSGKSIIGKR